MKNNKGPYSEKELGNTVVKGTAKDIEVIEDIYNTDGFDHSKFDKYFYAWVSEGTGMYYFPKEEYFVSYKGETNYAIALLKYGASNASLIRPISNIYTY